MNVQKGNEGKDQVLKQFHKLVANKSYPLHVV